MLELHRTQTVKKCPKSPVTKCVEDIQMFLLNMPFISRVKKKTYLTKPFDLFIVYKFPIIF